MPQRTKLFGLKKLKKIVANSGQWSVAPYKVYSDPEQFRLKHTLDRPRLLVRTDERGRNYKIFDWSGMPRTEFEATDEWGFKNNEKTMRENLSKFDSNFKGDTKVSMFRRGRDRLSGIASRIRRLIVHPTFLREKIALTGRIELFKSPDGGSIVRISFLENPSPAYRLHRKFFEPTSMNSFYIRSNHFSFSLSRGKLNPYLDNPKVKGQSREIVDSLVAFIERGVALKQINPRRLRTELNFLTWKDAPTKVEFFDLIEQRENQLNKRKIKKP